MEGGGGGKDPYHHLVQKFHFVFMDPSRMDKYFTKSANPPPHMLFCGESEDEEKPVLVSALPPQKNLLIITLYRN